MSKGSFPNLGRDNLSREISVAGAQSFAPTREPPAGDVSLPCTIYVYIFI